MMECFFVQLTIVFVLQSESQTETELNKVTIYTATRALPVSKGDSRLSIGELSGVCQIRVRQQCTTDSIPPTPSLPGPRKKEVE